ncbi:RkpR, polysaccharide export protein [Labrenzia sp. CE80]|uniref:RkpR, polysaccharide export protein n=1 Tax=Labrenzia sp. CE80 TaxID=1788986 RepID=UPI00129B41D6|nr:RkpR, polysaccharide export protein [Labrenzia sp. CE80]
MSSVQQKTQNGGSSDTDVVAVPQKGARNSTLSPIKDNSLVDRLKKSGLDPHKLLDLTLPGTSKGATAKARHRVLSFGFLLFVAIPSVVFSIYMFFWASDQYHSTAAFAVRSSNSTAATEILGMVLGGANESTTTDSYIINDYLQSQSIIEDLKQTIDLEGVFSRQETDWLFRMGQDLPVEDQLAYWNNMVDVSYDGTSGVIYLEVRTFHPSDSVAIADAILKRSELLVNKLSDANRRQTVRYAQETVARAEARLKAIRKQMLAYRDETQEVSPEDNAKIAMAMIAELDQQVVAKQAELKTLGTYLNAESPRIRLLSQEIEALQAQITNERTRLGVGTANVDLKGNSDRLALRISNYSDLKLEEEFANQFYTTALAGLEQARQDADRNSIYLATFITPTLSEDAQYPHRALYSLAFFLLLLGFWTVSILMYYNIRDRT